MGWVEECACFIGLVLLPFMCELCEGWVLECLVYGFNLPVIRMGWVYECLVCGFVSLACV